MSRKNKLQKFAEISAFSNVLEAFTFEDGYLHANPDEKVKYTGNWSREFFKNENPLFLELACGKGEYTLGLSALYPDRNFIGMDIKGNRIWKGAKRALQEERKNVGFVRSRIEFITSYFGSEEIDGIWITFPDPFLKERDERRRLTSPEFLDRYTEILKDGGRLHLKTDDDQLYYFSLETLQAHPAYRIEAYSPDIYKSSQTPPELEIRTFYEQQHLTDGKTIKYIRATMHRPQV